MIYMLKAQLSLELILLKTFGQAALQNNVLIIIELSSFSALMIFLIILSWQLKKKKKGHQKGELTPCLDSRHIFRQNSFSKETYGY